MTKAIAVIATLAVIVASADSADAGWRRCGRYRGHSHRCCGVQQQQYYAPTTGCWNGAGQGQYGTNAQGTQLDAYGNPINAPLPPDENSAPRPAPQEDSAPRDDGAPQPNT